MPHRNLICFSILFVALSHCDKDLFCLSHWVTATNRFVVCCTESLRQTKLVYVSKKMPKSAKKKLNFCYLLHFKALFVPFRQFCAVFCILFAFLACFAFFSATNNNFVWRSDSVWQTKNPFVAVTQCDKQNKSLSQWLSATNNFERNIQFCCGMWKGIGKKTQKQTLFQNWISPPISNCFEVPSKLYESK